MSRAVLLKRIRELEAVFMPEEPPKAGLVQIIGLEGPTAAQLAVAARAREEGRPVIAVQTVDASTRPDPDGDADVH